MRLGEGKGARGRAGVTGQKEVVGAESDGKSQKSFVLVLLMKEQ